jgi:membrane protein
MRCPSMPRWLARLPLPGRLPLVRQALALLRRSVAEFRDDHCQQMASAIAFHVLFAVFPLAIMAIGIAGLVTQDAHARDSIVAAVVRVVPLSAQGRGQLHDLLASAGGGASALGLLGLAGAVWSASGMMSAIRTALNIAWDTDAKRPFVRGKLVDLALIVGTLLITGVTLGLTVASGIIRNSAGHLPQALRGITPATVTAARVAVIVISDGLLFATFAFLYRFVPAVPTRLHGIWPGALTAAVGMEALQYGFSVYVSFFAHYNRVYGSLGAIVAFMFFSYLAAMVFLFGAEVASEYPRMRGYSEEEQTAA